MVSRASRVEVVGPLEAYQPGFQQALAGAGYTPLSALKQIQLMKHLSIWLEEQDLGAIDLSGSVVGAYLAARRADWYTSRLSVKVLSPLLAYLRGLGIAPLSVTAIGTMLLDQLIDRYRRYLVEQRGLVPRSVRDYMRVAYLFLDTLGVDGRVDEIDAGVVTAFVTAECRHRGRGSAKCLLTGLRSLLRFLVLNGVTSLDLSGAALAVADWRGSALPRDVSASDVEVLLRSCDRATCVGRRNRAILTLLVRLGLRACEVARHCNRHRSPRDRTGWAALDRALGRVKCRPRPSRRQAPSPSLYGASSLAFKRGVRVRC